LFECSNELVDTGMDRRVDKAYTHTHTHTHTHTFVKTDEGMHKLSRLTHSH